MIGRVAHEARINAVQHDLGSPKHPERIGVVDVSPCEVDEPFTAGAVNCGPAKVECTIAVDHDADIKLPTCIGRVASHQLFGFGPDLHTDMDVSERCAVGLAERAPCKSVPITTILMTNSLVRS
jgi:hypothetical protein